MLQTLQVLWKLKSSQRSSLTAQIWVTGRTSILAILSMEDCTLGQRLIPISAAPRPRATQSLQTVQLLVKGKHGVPGVQRVARRSVEIFSDSSSRPHSCCPLPCAPQACAPVSASALVLAVSRTLFTLWKLCGMLSLADSSSVFSAVTELWRFHALFLFIAP